MWTIKILIPILWFLLIQNIIRQIYYFQYLLVFTNRSVAGKFRNHIRPKLSSHEIAVHAVVSSPVAAVDHRMQERTGTPGSPGSRQFFFTGQRSTVKCRKYVGRLKTYNFQSYSVINQVEHLLMQTSTATYRTYLTLNAKTYMKQNTSWIKHLTV